MPKRKPQLAVVETAPMRLLPCAKGLCQICAVDHQATFPHNKDSLFYQMQFKGRFDRWPTWADAVAHCDAQMQSAWKKLLSQGGHWTEPPKGVDAVAQDYRDGFLPAGREDG